MGIAKNYLYNVAYQLLLLVLPIITLPYITRVLGSEGVGINSYTNSVIQFFILFGTLGIGLYGNRQIAYVRNNQEERSRTFWSIFALTVATTTAALVVFLVSIYLMNSKYIFFYLLQSINILAAAVDISWFFMGMEDFKKTVTRNTVVKILGILCIFIFVRDRQDLWLYILINSVSAFLGQLVMWVYLPKYVSRSRISLASVRSHLVPVISLFIPQIAIQVYAVLDKTMVGILATEAEVGFYDMSQRIIKMSLIFLTSMGTVMLPRVANTFASGNIEKVKDYFVKSFKFSTYLVIPSVFGLLGITKEFVPWFFGNEFIKSGTLIAIGSPILVALAWSNVLGLQLMLPMGRNKGFNISVITGAVVNFVLNLVLIPAMASVGASIATLAAEFMVTGVQFYMMRDYIDFRKTFDDLWKYLLASIFMYLGIRAIGISLGASSLTTLLQITAGIVIYFILMKVLKSDINESIIGIVKNISVNLLQKLRRGR